MTVETFIREVCSLAEARGVLGGIKISETSVLVYIPRHEMELAEELRKRGFEVSSIGRVHIVRGEWDWVNRRTAREYASDRFPRWKWNGFIWK